MDLRVATGPEDLAACVAVYLDATNGRLEAKREASIDEDDVPWLADSLPHLLRTDPAGVIVATEAGQVAGFGVAFRRERFWFLSQLQVRREEQGHGLGTQILQRLLPSPVERRGLVLATTVEAAQPVSTMLYAKEGIVPRAPCYWFSELPSIEGLPTLPEDVRGFPFDQERDLSALGDLDRSLLGYARPEDHLAWKDEATDVRVYVDRDGAVIGYGYRSPGWLSPVASVHAELVPGIMRDLLDGSTGTIGEVTIGVPGDAAELLPALLRAGMRADRSGAEMLYCSTGPGLPGSYLFYGGHHP